MALGPGLVCAIAGNRAATRTANNMLVIASLTLVFISCLQNIAPCLSSVDLWSSTGGLQNIRYTRLESFRHRRRTRCPRRSSRQPTTDTTPVQNIDLMPIVWVVPAGFPVFHSLCQANYLDKKNPYIRIIISWNDCRRFGAGSLLKRKERTLP